MGTTRHLRGVLGMIHASGWACGNHDSSARTRLCNTQHIESPLRGDRSQFSLRSYSVCLSGISQEHHSIVHKLTANISAVGTAIEWHGWKMELALVYLLFHPEESPLHITT